MDVSVSIVETVEVGRGKTEEKERIQIFNGTVIRKKGSGNRATFTVRRIVAGDVLHDQATLLRERRSMRAEEKAASASVQILVPCLFLVMACIICVFGPFIIRVVRGGLF